MAGGAEGGSMNVRLFALLALIYCCSISYAEEAVEIPQGEIWALDMPGTKDIRELEPNRDAFKGMSAAERIENSLIENTRRLLNINNRPSYGSVAGRGAVVAASDLEALKLANAILANKQPRTEFFDSSEELTLVFFAYESGKCVRLKRVYRTDKEVVVEYRFETKTFPNSSSQIALIPLEKLPPGNRYVSIKRLDEDATNAELRQHRQAVGRQVVCDSFTFEVRE